uniref:Beta-carotene isomerase D27-like C-terminal domain-containing protein n=1 Tax=Oryza meridionalis TaxID=40149 RepID=A0A0E0DLL1_9ORYZ
MAAPSPPCLLRVLLPVASSSSRGLRRRRRPTTSLLRCSSPSADTASSSGEGGREYEPSFADDFLHAFFRAKIVEFNFGVSPPPLDTDKALKEPCLDICTNARRRKELGTGSSTDSLQCPQV